jgi:hypothetical protein
MAGDREWNKGWAIHRLGDFTEGALWHQQCSRKEQSVPMLGLPNDL